MCLSLLLSFTIETKFQNIATGALFHQSMLLNVLSTIVTARGVSASWTSFYWYDILVLLLTLSSLALLLDYLLLHLSVQRPSCDQMPAVKAATTIESTLLQCGRTFREMGLGKVEEGREGRGEGDKKDQKWRQFLPRDDYPHQHTQYLVTELCYNVGGLSSKEDAGEKIIHL